MNIGQLLEQIDWKTKSINIYIFYKYINIKRLRITCETPCKLLIKIQNGIIMDINAIRLKRFESRLASFFVLISFILYKFCYSFCCRIRIKYEFIWESSFQISSKIK